MAKVIATNRGLQEGKHVPFAVQFGNLDDPSTVTEYKFKTDGNEPPFCVGVKDPEHLAKLVASGYSIEPDKGEKEEDLEPVKAQGEQLKVAAKKKEQAEQARLDKAAEAKRKLAQAKTKPQVTTIGSVE